MTKQPLLTYLPNMLAEYEKRHDFDSTYVSIYPNGKGRIRSSYHYIPVFEFDSIPELIEKLNQ